MKRRSGLTMIELIVVMVVLGILMVALMPYLTSIRRVYEYSDEQTQMLQSGRVASDKITRILKSVIEIVDIDISGNGDYIEIVDVNYNRIAFFHNVNVATVPWYDNTLDDNDLVMRTYDSAGNPVHSILAKSVNDLNFEYLADDMTLLNLATPNLTPDETCAVRLNMSFQGTSTDFPSDLPISVVAYCRTAAKEDEGGAWLVEYNTGDLVLVSPGG